MALYNLFYLNNTLTLQCDNNKSHVRSVWELTRDYANAGQRPMHGNMLNVDCWQLSMDSVLGISPPSWLTQWSELFLLYVQSACCVMQGRKDTSGGRLGGMLTNGHLLLTIDIIFRVLNTRCWLPYAVQSNLIIVAWFCLIPFTSVKHDIGCVDGRSKI